MGETSTSGKLLTLTNSSKNSRSIFGRYTLDEKWKGLAAGVYGKGLLTICDDETYTFDALKPYVNLLGVDALPVAYTAFGDVFCMCPEYRTFMLLYAELYEAEDIGDQFSWFLENLPTDKYMREDLLHNSIFKAVSAKKGPLQYGQCLTKKDAIDYLPNIAKGYQVVNHLHLLRF